MQDATLILCIGLVSIGWIRTPANVLWALEVPHSWAGTVYSWYIEEIFEQRIASSEIHQCFRAHRPEGRRVEGSCCSELLVSGRGQHGAVIRKIGCAITV